MPWPLLIASKRKNIRQWAYSLTKDNDEADDLTHDVIIKVLQSEDKFEPGSNLHAWLSTCTRNLFVTGFLKKKRIGAPVDIEQLQSHGLEAYSESNSGEADLSMQEISIALDRLPPSYRRAIDGRIDGLQYDEIAKLEGIPIGTIKNRIYKARELLKRVMMNVKSTVLSDQAELD